MKFLEIAILSLFCSTTSLSLFAQDGKPQVGLAQLVEINGEESKPSGSQFVYFKPTTDREFGGAIEIQFIADSAQVKFQGKYVSPLVLTNQVISARGVEGLTSGEEFSTLTFTPPGPSVLRIPIAKIPAGYQLVRRTLTNSKVIVPEDKIQAVIAHMKTAGFNGSDDELDRFVRERSIESTEQTETWRVHLLEFLPGVEIKELTLPRSTSTPPQLLLNITAAWQSCITQFLHLAASAQTSTATGPAQRSSQALFNQAVQAVVQQ